MKLVTPYRFSKLAGVSYQTVYERIRKGNLPVIENIAPDGSTKIYIDIDLVKPEKIIIKKNM